MDNRWKYQRTGGNKRENNPNYRGGKEIPCTQCDKLFYRKPSEIKKRKNHFCSRKCHDEFRRKPKKPARVMKGETHPRWAGKRFCKICGKELLDRNSRKQFTCFSQKCIEESKRRGNKKGKIVQYGEGGGRTTYTCKHCGKVVETTVSTANRRQFCSQHCHVLSGSNLRFAKPTKLEFAVATALDSLELEYIAEHCPKNSPGRYDFFVPSLNLLIEADGYFWHHSDWAKENTDSTERDERKTKWALDNGYKLIRLDEYDVLEAGADILLRDKLEVLG